MAMIHVNRGATSLGAFPEDQVREGIRAGQFLPSDLGWKEGMTSWAPLSQFAEFASEVAAAPAGASPPPTAAPSAIAPVAGTSASPAPRSGLPWDQRLSKGFFTAFIETLQMVLTRPADAFTAMKTEGGLGDPLIYALIGGCVGGAVSFLFSIGLQSVGLFGHQRNAVATMAGLGIGSFAFLILLPVLITVGLFVGAGIIHLCLMIVGGANKTFETTFRVLAFSHGSTGPLQIIPLCGGAVAGVWALVVNCIGLARAHETTTGRAVLAVFMPLIVCCGGALILAMMFGALGAWSASQH